MSIEALNAVYREQIKKLKEKLEKSDKLLREVLKQAVDYEAKMEGKLEAVRKLLEECPISRFILDGAGEETGEIYIAIRKDIEKWLEKVHGVLGEASPIDSCPKCGIFKYACKCAKEGSKAEVATAESPVLVDAGDRAAQAVDYHKPGH